jgi:GNAT superfamily N-acetyltransferase
MTIDIHRMAASELARLGEIDRSERITQQYRCCDGVLELVDVDIDAPRWGEPGENPLERLIDEWRALVDGGGVLLGAFDGDRLVGIAIFDSSFDTEPARFAVLHVSRSHRRSGVGRELTARIVGLAKATGAERLYVSATPTRGTVDFYMSQGFTPLAEPNAALLALEPDDIHLAMTL